MTPFVRRGSTLFKRVTQDRVHEFLRHPRLAQLVGAGEGAHADGGGIQRRVEGRMGDQLLEGVALNRRW